MNIGDNYLDNNFSLWFSRFLKTCRLEFGIYNLTEVDLSEMGLSKGLSDIKEQLRENRLLHIADSLPKQKEEILMLKTKSHLVKGQ